MIELKKFQPIAATSMAYRPRDYFGRHDVQTALMTHVKGTARRDALQKALDAGQIHEVPGGIKNAALNDATRQFAGSLHPSLMSGEYGSHEYTMPNLLVRCRAKGVRQTTLHVKASSDD